MGQVVSRRTLLTRAGIGTGAGVFALLGVTAAPAFAAASISDLANVRIVCVAKRIAINWYTQWVNTPEGGRRQRHRRPDPRDPQRRSRGTTACSRRCSAPPRRSTTTTRTRSRRARCARRRARPRSRSTSRRCCVGIVVGAAATTVDPDVAPVAGAASSPATASTSARSRCSPAARRSPDGLPRALGIEDGGNQLAQFLSN